MKKALFFIMVAAIGLMSAQAQISAGIKGGLTMANMNLDEPENTSADFALGGHAAVFLKTGKGLFGFQPEVMFIQKGTRLNSTNDAAYSQLTMNYIDVPLLARISIGINVVQVYLNIGPYGGYWIGGKTKDYTYDPVQAKWITDKDDYEFDDDHDIRYDAGIVAGAGVRVLMLMFEVRYGHGFINVFDYDNDDSKYQNRYLNFTLGLQL